VSASAGALFTIASTSAPSASTAATAEAEKSPDPEEAAKSVDLRTTGYFHKIWNQGQLGSCVAHALAGAFTFVHQKQLDSKEDHFEPSRLFLYYNIRAGGNKVGIDDGGSVLEGMYSLSEKGVCAEERWKYQPWGSYKRKDTFKEGSRVAKQPIPLA
jgi:C1A family cysteine protease